AMLFALAAALTKREGPALAAVTLTAFILPSWREIASWSWWVKLKWLLATAVIVALVLALTDTRDLQNDATRLSYHPETLSALVRHPFTWSSFHLAFWLLPPALIAILLLPWTRLKWSAISLTISLLSVWAAIFVLTSNYVFAANDQTPSRSALQI